ncbi:hypothetical protein KKF81_07095 [Candidatus Micrarchaeota archaeon]|nr:hypothetical protein [Candidatus Micrarchaeota archaeon]MBU1166697.1 hypothetical protein [Candidatus Micrarchaeota archaeon]MBU1886122.1 hypothetical protein [Candidatus Micrarchaeota archaeon]
MSEITFLQKLCDALVQGEAHGYTRKNAKMLLPDTIEGAVKRNETMGTEFGVFEDRYPDVYMRCMLYGSALYQANDCPPILKPSVADLLQIRANLFGTLDEAFPDIVQEPVREESPTHTPLIQSIEDLRTQVRSDGAAAGFNSSVSPSQRCSRFRAFGAKMKRLFK